MVPDLSALDSLERLHFKKGDYLFKEGDQSFFFFIIEEGEVDIHMKDQNAHDEEIHLATLTAGQPVGEFALVTRKPRVASAQARTDVSAVKVSEEGYQALLTDLPEWAFQLIKSLIERLQRTDDLLRKNQIHDGLTETGVSDILRSTSR